MIYCLMGGYFELLCALQGCQSRVMLVSQLGGLWYIVGKALSFGYSLPCRVVKVMLGLFHS